MTYSNVLLKIVTELFTFSSFCLLYIAFFILYVAAYMANKVVYILHRLVDGSPSSSHDKCTRRVVPVSCGRQVAYDRRWPSAVDSQAAG